MNNRDFFYWLQGHFELGATHTYIDKRQADLIVRHAAMVQDRVCERLIEVRTLARLLLNEPAVEAAAMMTNDIQNIVSAEFVHVLDPQDGGPDAQAKLNALHKANPHLDPAAPRRPDNITMRC